MIRILCLTFSLFLPAVHHPHQIINNVMLQCIFLISDSGSWILQSQNKISSLWFPISQPISFHIKKTESNHSLFCQFTREVILEKQLKGQGHRVDRSICSWFWDHYVSQGCDLSKVFFIFSFTVFVFRIYGSSSSSLAIDIEIVCIDHFLCLIT